MRNSNKDSRPEALEASPPEPSGLGARLLELTSHIVDLFGNLDLQSLPDEVFAADAFFWMEGLRNLLRTPQQKDSESAYVARNAALFIVEALSRSLRRDIDPRDVSLEKAQLLDAMFGKIQSAKTGAAGATPDLSRLDELERDSLELMQQAIKQQRLVFKVPLTK